MMKDVIKKAMVKEKIADGIACVGLILGVVAGIIVMRAELYLSPMSYTETYTGLISYFYFYFAMVATPFLIVRFFIRTQHKKLAILLVACVIMLLALLFWGDGV